MTWDQTSTENSSVSTPLVDRVSVIRWMGLRVCFKYPVYHQINEVQEQFQEMMAKVSPFLSQADLETLLMPSDQAGPAPGRCNGERVLCQSFPS